jgi:hypothetical protein
MENIKHHHSYQVQIKQRIKNSAHDIVSAIISHSIIKSNDILLEMSRVETALRKERQLGLHGHWAYDLNRHFYLAQCLNKLKTKKDAE